MKLIFEKLLSGSEGGFIFKRIHSHRFSCPWHFHTENELILTLHCPGYRMVGDDITELETGDLVLVGSNLPHIWQRDEGKPHQRQPVHILIVQFEENFLGHGFWQISAAHALRGLLKRASVGLQFIGRTREQVARLMSEMDAASALRRLALFLTALEALAASTECLTIASPGYTAESSPFDQERMERVLRFINERLDEPIRLREAARLACLSEGAFSRFFHLHTGRTFPAFVNQLRIGRACRLLAESENKITDIAFACGFTNLSNFNRQFQRLKQMTPQEFGRQLSRPSLSAPQGRSAR
jgi:AraC-like DNA-binding protein